MRKAEVICWKSLHTVNTFYKPETLNALIPHVKEYDVILHGKT